MIYHFYKTDCYKASRVLMQSQWEGQSKFVHICSKGDYTFNYKFGWPSLLKILHQSSQHDTIIFHAQSALPYLVLAYFISLFSFKDINLIYDVHDLHEDSAAHKFLSKSRIRFIVLLYLENLIFKIKKIKKITVSDGLSKVMASRYNCDELTVVRNVSVFEPNSLESNLRENDSSLLFFGTSERVPLTLIPELISSDVKLHIYGRGITEEWIRNKINIHDLKGIKTFGEYSPRDLSFLRKYKILILYSPEDLSLNFRYSLPNKLFQALSAGLTVLVSENFAEIINLFSDIEMAVVPVTKENLTYHIKIIENEKTIDQTQKIQSKVKLIMNESRRNYLMLLGRY